MTLTMYKINNEQISNFHWNGQTCLIQFTSLMKYVRPVTDMSLFSFYLVLLGLLLSIFYITQIVLNYISILVIVAGWSHWHFLPSQGVKQVQTPCRYLIRSGTAVWQKSWESQFIRTRYYRRNVVCTVMDV